jgi:hypothetical protein
MATAPRSSAQARIAWAIGGALVLATAVWLASLVPNADWSGQYDAAARGIFLGRSPYEQLPYSNPPWTALFLTPFTILPPNLARGAVLVCTLAAWIYIGWRLRAPKIAFIAMLLSPTAIAALLAANVDAFVMLGVFLPPTLGLFLLMMKPQVGLGAVFLDLVSAWRERGVGGVLRVFAPLCIALGLSAFLFPEWVDRMIRLTANGWNRSLFPFGVPIGVLLLWIAVRKGNAFWALVASPFFAPYLTFPSYLVIQIGFLHPDVERLIRRDVLQVLMCVLLWVIMLHFRL